MAIDWILSIKAVCSVAFAAIALQLFIQLIITPFFHPLSKFPGTYWSSVSRTWMAYEFWKGTELSTLKALHKKYGPVIRATPNMLIVSDPEKLPEMYNRSADKSDWYITPVFGPVENIIVTLPHKGHARLRKIMAGPYSFSNVKKLEDLVDARIERWFERLDEVFIQAGKPVDFTQWSVYLAYDIISEIGFGAPVGFIEAGCDAQNIIPNLHYGLHVKAILNRLYPLIKFVQRTGIGQSYFKTTPGDSSGLGILMKLRDELLKKRLADLESGKKGRSDLLQTLLNARTSDDKPLDIEYIKSEVLLVLTAGADTTGTVMQGLIHHVLTMPEVKRKLMAEIAEAEKTGILSKIPQYEEVAHNMPYYVACVHEVLRLWPSSPTFFPRVVGPQGIMFDNKLAPPGVEVAASPWLIQRNEKFYGADAEKFNPDRWLDPERSKLYQKYLFTFGYGARVCLGKDIALMEIYKAPLQFLQKFDISLRDEQSAGKYTVIGGVSYWKDMFLNVTPRQKASSDNK